VAPPFSDSSLFLAAVHGTAGHAEQSAGFSMRHRGADAAHGSAAYAFCAADLSCGIATADACFCSKPMLAC